MCRGEGEILGDREKGRKAEDETSRPVFVCISRSLSVVSVKSAGTCQTTTALLVSIKKPYKKRTQDGACQCQSTCAFEGRSLGISRVRIRIEPHAANGSPECHLNAQRLAGVGLKSAVRPH